MSSLLLLIRSIAPGMYILGVLGLLRGLTWLLAAQGELRYAQFPLERNMAERLGGKGITLMLISLQLTALIWLLANPFYRQWESTVQGEQEAQEAESQDRVFTTAIPVLESGGGLTVPTAPPEGPGIIRTQPPSPTPAGTLRPADDPAGCIFDQAYINIPDNGQVVFQAEPIIGTANIADFGFYRFEIRNLDRGDNFSPIGGAEADYYSPVVNGPLGSIIPQNFEVGEHRFRLVVFDSAANLRATCEITLFISEPLPTPTPIGGNVIPGIPPAGGGISPPQATPTP